MLGYIRVSTDQQADSGLGLAAQTDMIRGVALAYSYELVHIYEDAGYSAGKLERPALKRALAVLKAGEADGLIVAQLDRLTRSLKDLSVLIEEYFRTWLLVSCQERIDTGSSTGVMMLNLLTTISQWERERISERTAAAAAVKRKRGLAHGNPPRGWQATPDGRLIPNLTEQTIIRTVKHLAQQGYPQRRIMDEVNKLGYRTRKGKLFTIAAIADMLQHEDTVDPAFERRRKTG